MASDPITLWKIEEKKVEAVTGFILWSFKILCMVAAAVRGGWDDLGEWHCNMYTIM